MSREAMRRSFQECPETCPAVDQVFAEWLEANSDLIPPGLSRPLDDLVSDFKSVGTERMRDRLTTVCGDLIDAERDAESLRERVSELEAEVAELRRALADLESQLEEHA